MLNRTADEVLKLKAGEPLKIEVGKQLEVKASDVLKLWRRLGTRCPCFGFGFVVLSDLENN